MKVIVDLHAVQGSQNGQPHSASRDGYREWGESYIPDTVATIDFLAERYIILSIRPFQYPIKIFVIMFVHKHINQYVELCKINSYCEHQCFVNRETFADISDTTLCKGFKGSLNVFSRFL